MTRDAVLLVSDRDDRVAVKRPGCRIVPCEELVRVRSGDLRIGSQDRMVVVSDRTEEGAGE
jgi:hypothetical protein